MSWQFTVGLCAPVEPSVPSPEHRARKESRARPEIRWAAGQLRRDHAGAKLSPPKPRGQSVVTIQCKSAFFAVDNALGHTILAGSEARSVTNHDTRRFEPNFRSGSKARSLVQLRFRSEPNRQRLTFLARIARQDLPSRGQPSA
jgi:hypothetical protein